MASREGWRRQDLYLVGLAVLALVAWAADTATFRALVDRHGLGAELNPLARTLEASRLAEPMKALVAQFVLAIAAIADRRSRRLAIVVLGVMFVAGSTGAWSNLAP